MATQRRIKAAGSDDDDRMRSNNSSGNYRKNNNKRFNRRRSSSSSSSKASLQLAINVLDTFLRTKPEECNAANLVCSLTLSAKLVSQMHHRNNAVQVNRPQKETPLLAKFRTLRGRVFAILDQLVTADLLSPRQLCNSAWAVGKHFAFDGSILPGDGMGLEMGMRERWNLSSGSNSNSNGIDSDDTANASASANASDEAREQQQHTQQQQRLASTMDDIAVRLTDVLDSYDGVGDNVVKVGELTMACWAYASTRPRNVPPGWELPPRVGRVPAAAAAADASGEVSDGSSSKLAEDVVIFERWDEVAGESSSSTRVVEHFRNDESKSDRIMDDLFDAVANTLCWEQEYATNKSPSLLRECPWKDISTIAWSFATRGHFGSESTEYLIAAAVKEASRRLDAAPRGAAAARNNGGRGNNRGSQSGRPNNRNDRTSRFIPRDVSQLAWSVGVLQCDNYRLGDSLVELVGAISRRWIGLGVDKHWDAAQRPFENWQTADLVQLAVALSHGRIDDVGLLSEIYHEAFHIILMGDKAENVKGGSFRQNNGRHRRWQSWELSIMLWVQANLYLTSKQGSVFGVFSEAVPRTLLRRVQRQIDNGNEIASVDSIGIGAQEQANLAWSLTVLQEHFSEESKDLLRSIFRSASSSYRSGSFIRLENAHQLWQSYFLLEEECPDVVADVNKSFRDYLERTWNAEKSRQKISSARHRSLSQTLDLMGVAHYNEHHEDIDVAIILKTESSWTHTAERGDHEESHHKVAVEFDGPKHFTRMSNEKPRALGHTVLKYRILKKQGWAVVRVPYYEFDKIPFWASMERQRYLQRLLKTHDDIRFSEVDRSEYTPLVPSRQTRFD